MVGASGLVFDQEVRSPIAGDIKIESAVTVEVARHGDLVVSKQIFIGESQGGELEQPAGIPQPVDRQDVGPAGSVA